jgi:two-component system chemotaxis response regulator CheB
MAHRNIVVLGASAGGLEAVLKIVGALPADWPASLCIVLHSSVESDGLLSQIIRRAGPLPVVTVKIREPLRPAWIYVAPVDRHLLLERGYLEVTGGPKENGFRPAVDPLFRTAAEAYGPRVIGVVLSGGLDDGTRGRRHIKRAGGLTLVQDPDDALVKSMPESAVRNVEVDHVVPAAELGRLLSKLVQDEIAEEVRATVPEKRTGPDPAKAGDHAMEEGFMPGPPSSFVCPECGGALWELRDGALLHYDCHVGHSYTADGLVVRHAEKLDAALWTALRTLEEHAGLRRHMAENMRHRGLDDVARKYEDQAAQLEERADVIRRVVTLAEPRLPQVATGEAVAVAESGNGNGRKPASPQKSTHRKKAT